MPSLNIDVALPDDITKYLQQPTCDYLLIPPPPPPIQLCLPFGGRIQGIVDVTRTIPDDCSLSFSLLLQLPPLMASLGCFIKLLGLIKPLIEVIKGIAPPDPVALAQAVPDFIKASVDVVACIAQVELGVPMFVRDLLLLIAKLLKCMAKALKDIATMMSGLSISIATAKVNKNTELLAQLQCAQNNANAQAQAALGSMDMIATVLAVAEPLLALAGVNFTLPTLGSAQDAQGLEDAANVMLSIGTSLETIAKALPTC
jgi:hypothetical protein